MIELKVKDIPGKAKYTFWSDLAPWMTGRTTINFSLFDYRIDGVIYTKVTPEFEKAFEQVIIWGTLNDTI